MSHFYSFIKSYNKCFVSLTQFGDTLQNIFHVIYDSNGIITKISYRHLFRKIMGNEFSKKDSLWMQNHQVKTKNHDVNIFCARSLSLFFCCVYIDRLFWPILVSKMAGLRQQLKWFMNIFYKFYWESYLVIFVIKWNDDVEYLNHQIAGLNFKIYLLEKK